MDGMTEIVIEAAHAVARNFVHVASDHVVPGMIYDVSRLPYEKTFIRNACLVWMQANRQDPEMKGWKVVFPVLAQFQEGVGPVPLGIDFAAVDHEEMSGEEISLYVSGSRMPSRELSLRVGREYEELREIADRVLS